MCWVMPPASPAATSVSRIASSSEVLPWSTWPMIVTTGGRSTRLSSASSNSGASGSSSAAVTISILRSYSSAIAFTESSVRVCVSVAISPIIISFLITSALPRPSSSATSRTVAPDWTLVASGSGRLDFGRRLLEQRAAAAATAAPRRALRRRAAHLVAARGLRVDHDAAFFGDAAAGGGGFRGRFGRFFRGRLSAPRRRLSARGFRLRLWRLSARRFRSPWRRRRPWRPRRLQRVGLLDARGRGFRLDAGGFQRREQLFAAQPLGFGDLVNALLCH